MRIFDKIREFFNKMIRPAAGADDERLLEWLGISGTPKKVLGEAVSYTHLRAHET